MQFTSTQKKALAWAALLIGAVMLLWLLAPVLTPFVVAAILAYALTPVVDWLDDLGQGRLPRVVAVVLVELVFLAMLLSIALLIVPILVKQLPQLREQVPPLLDQLNLFMAPKLAALGLHVSLDVAGIRAFLMEHLSANLEDGVSQLLASAKMGGSVALSLLGNAVLIPVALFYFLMDWRRFIGMLLNLVPPGTRSVVDSFTEEADSVLGQYFRGQILVMLVLAVYYSVGLALFGLDLALPIGVFTGLAIAIPYVGFGLGLILALLAGFLEFSAQSGHVSVLVMVAVVYGLGQLVESFFLTPRLVGERIGLHPLAVIFALLAFGHSLGFVGVLIALPLSAVLLVAIRRARDTYLRAPSTANRDEATGAGHGPGQGAEPEQFLHRPQCGGAGAPAAVAGSAGQGRHAALPGAHLFGAPVVAANRTLRAVCGALQAQGQRVGWLDATVSIAEEFDDTWAVVLLDDVHAFDAGQQQAAFNWFVNAQTQQIAVLAAGSLPPADLKLRDDLRTRLGWGHVFALQTLDEPQRREVLRASAQARGIVLSDEVMDFMLTRFSRDLGSLMELLDLMDGYALQTQRAITIPLIKTMMDNA